MPQTETFKSIQDWAWSTFGRADPVRTFERAGEEWDELTDEFFPFSSRETALEPWHHINAENVATEAADVIITLLNIEGVPEAIDAKMAKNRARKWQVMGDGTGYHIKETEA